MTIKITADLIVKDATLREQYMNRVDVLTKVKKLLILPELDMATTQQVAGFYEVETDTIRQMLRDHREELVSDGYTTMRGKELLSEIKSPTKNYRGYCLLEDGTKITFGVSALFPRRAILRVGMLLRDSEIAKEVRTQLLNIEEKATAEVKVAEIDREGELMLAVLRSNTPDERAVALAEYRTYTSRHVEKVEAKLAEAETENDLLSN